MMVEAIKVIDSTNGTAVVGGSRVELARFFDHLAASHEVQKLGQQQGVSNEKIRALFVESVRLLQLIRPLHVIRKAA